jgi:hypothetical protein
MGNVVAGLEPQIEILYKQGVGSKWICDRLGLPRTAAKAVRCHLIARKLHDPNRKPPKGPRHTTPEEVAKKELRYAAKRAAIEARKAERAKQTADRRCKREAEAKALGTTVATLYYYRNHEALKAKQKVKALAYYQENKHDPDFKEKRRAVFKSWRTRNPEKLKEGRRKWAERNPGYFSTKRKEWMQTDAGRAYLRDYRKRPAQKLLRGQRKRLKELIKKGRATSVLRSDFLGCSPVELVYYIERQFTRGMHWSNYGQWHIDHIRPCASFNLLDPEQVKQCWHFSNLRPLWAEDNIEKSDRWDGQQLLAV